MENKRIKLSLSFINIALIVIFIITIVAGISFSGYFTSKKILDYNINEYRKQIKNITDIIVESELSNLNIISSEISEILKVSKIENLEEKINIISAIDQIDLLFLKTDNKISDYSNSIFNTKKIIDKLEEKRIPLDNLIISIDILEEKYILFLNKKDIIEKDTGRVKTKLYTGKILNDNFYILDQIKRKANLVDIYIYFGDELIATTSNKEIERLEDKSTVKKNNLFFLRSHLDTYNEKRIELIFVVENSTFELLKNDYLNSALLLLLFIFISSLTLYLANRKFIIIPFSELLIFAKNAKDNKNEIFRTTNVKEFNHFATDLKVVIDELRELKEKYSKAIDGVEDGIWDFNFKTNEVFYSKNFLEMLGYSTNDNINSIDFWKDGIHKDDYKRTLKKIAKHRNGKTSFYEDNYRFLCKNGLYKWIKIRGRVFLDENNEPLEITGFHTDINEIINLQIDNKQKEQMIFHQSKLASMGEIIGNIAHQWRQPLNIISTISSNQVLQIEMRNFNEEDILKDLEKINTTIIYLSTIIDKFRYFFDPKKEIEIFKVKDAISQNLEIFKSSYNSDGIKLICKIDDISIKGYKFELTQVTINLINNSKDALLSRLESNEEKYVFIEAFKEDNYLIIKVYDNAKGIERKIKGKIYEPYFSTKHKSEGTGLGLYMSQEIIKKEFKGRISNKTITFVYNNIEYKGEEFKIKIPIE